MVCEAYGRLIGLKISGRATKGRNERARAGRAKMNKRNLRMPRDGQLRKFHPFFDSKIDLNLVTAEQGGLVITSIDELRGDFWPEDETEDEFLKALRSWREEDRPGAP
jgi:hypothetical protein